MSKIEEALAKASLLRKSDKAISNRKTNMGSAIKPSDRANQYLVTINQPDSQIVEEYRRLKSMLLRETKADFLNTIMITSSVPGEGKSLTAINLAITLAQEIDHSILLVDTDLRNPMLNEYLGIKYEYGLSDYLTMDIDVADILIKTDIGNLVILPAGRSVDNPVELLSSAKMKALVQELKQRYMDRYVIIDSPPILSCSESIAISSYVDGVVFVVQEGNARRKSIEHALSMIKDLNILGIVFNNVSEENLEGHHSNYDYKYKRYGEK